MKNLVIYNNKAGNGRAESYLDEIKSLLKENNVDFDIIFTEYKGFPTDFLKSKDLSQYASIIAAGGDGTVFEVLNGIMKNTISNVKPTLGIIPIGTGNAFVRDMGLLDHNYKEAIEIISKGNKKEIDVGKINTKDEVYYFLNIVGLGFVSDVAKLAHKLKIFGNFSYTLGVLVKLIFLKSFNVKMEIDGEKIKRDNIFIEVSNSKYTSNFLMAPNAEIDDGFFDITLLNKISRFKLIKAFPKIFTGKHIFEEGVEVIKGKSIKISTEVEKTLTPDGEILGNSPVEINCLQEEIEVFWK